MKFGDEKGRQHPALAMERPESHYQTLLNAIDAGFCIIEVLFNEDQKPYDYRFLETNAAFEANTGIKDPTGKLMRDLAPAHEQHWFDIYGQIALSRQPVRFEQRAAALKRWYDVYAFPFGAPEWRQVAIFFRDVTKRKEGEEALRASEELSRSVLESSPDCVNIIDCDGRLQFINRNGLRLLELDDFTSIANHPWVQLWGQENAAEATNAFEEARTGSAAHFQAFCYTARGTPKFWDIVIAPVFDGKGNLPAGAASRLISVARDVTQRRQREEEISRSEQRFRTLASVVIDIPWVTNAAGEFVSFQSAWTRYTGQPWEKYRGFGWMDAVHPDDRSAVFEKWQNACRARTLFATRGRLFHASSGEYRHFDARALPLLNHDGSVREWVGSCTDIHEQIAAAQQLEQLVEERTAKLRETITDLEAFSYSIAHDMRAPLRAMQGFASILRQEDGQHLSPDGQLCISRIIAASDRMDRLINDILDYSSVVRSGLRLAPVEIEPLLRGILDFDPNLQPPRAEISILGPFPRLQANEAALTQCISHLLTNAVKFVAPGVTPRVRVWAETEDQRARLFFQDNGIGIDPELQDRIFHIFQQLAKDTAGTGIGLAIVKKAMHRMNGNVGVQSEPGKGSTFWLELPLA